MFCGICVCPSLCKDIPRNCIAFLPFLSFHRCLLSSVSFRLFLCLNDVWWLRHLVLKSVAVRPTYVSVSSLVVTVAWYTISSCKHSPSNGHSFSFRQWHIFLGRSSPGFMVYLAWLCYACL